jgi:hypothetical protein
VILYVTLQVLDGVIMACENRRIYNLHPLAHIAVYVLISCCNEKTRCAKEALDVSMKVLGDLASLNSNLYT